MKAPYINLHRSYQAVHLLPYLLQEYVRDGKRPKSNDTRAMFDHVVIQLLGRAMASEPKPGSNTKRNPLTVTDTCWPSVLTICRETALSESSVRRTLDRLIANGYITKSRIPGRKLRKGKGQNKYEGCRYHLVTDVWNLVDSPMDPAKREKADDVAAPIVGPIASPATRAAELAIANTLDQQSRGTDFESPSTRNKDNVIDSMVALLKKNFAAHPTFRHVDASQIMKNCIRGCVDTAGSAERCLSILQWICNDPVNEDKRAKLRHSNLLAGYITASFKGWLESDYPIWEEKEAQEEDAEIDEDEDEDEDNDGEEEGDAEPELGEDAELECDEDEGTEWDEDAELECDEDEDTEWDEYGERVG